VSVRQSSRDAPSRTIRSPAGRPGGAARQALLEAQAKLSRSVVEASRPRARDRLLDLSRRSARRGARPGRGRSRRLGQHAEDRGPAGRAVERERPFERGER
jgi:hypothetical protein